ncbi:ABC transporter ATP-binding protein [Paenibacillus sp. GCM10027627]|uniref:ABC transporter ATP-binding protein n=1 Tax=unclassified Paenibacillus TaxID=185978 RepID=UPI003635A937
MEIYTIENLNFAFPPSGESEHERKALSDICLTIHSGEFVALCGRSGSGKSTLLRQLKPILSPHGSRSGTVSFKGAPLEALDDRAQASEIGFVFQNPENGIVTDKVWHELAFGLESLGMDSRTIRLRVAEMASFFGIQNWFRRDVAELSGGQKQLLCLASIMAMHPEVLLLDEPTSQLDPIAAADFLETVKKINREFGTTVIMTEHRLEDVLPGADRVVVLEAGTILADGCPRQVGEKLRTEGHPLFQSMPTPMRVHAEVQGGASAPLTVKEGRQWLDRYLIGRNNSPKQSDEAEQGQGRTEQDQGIAEQDQRRVEQDQKRRFVLSPQSEKRNLAQSQSQKRRPALTLREVWFKYDKHGPDIVKDLTLDIDEGQLHCILGGNGTGKTTMLSLISGMNRPYRGKVLLGGKNPATMGAKELFHRNLGVLPQNPQSLFVKKTVQQDLLEIVAEAPLSREEKAEKVKAIAAFAELEELLLSHPYDLSGGEQQRAALAKVLLLEPKVLLLDEPTKGLDYFFKEKLAQLLKELASKGTAIVMVSHDIEFCAKHGDVCSLFFDGAVLATGPAKSFFAGNSFYTTAANRMVRHVWDSAVTAEDVMERCRL